MELAYHYQFYKVFGTDEKLREGKTMGSKFKNIHPDTIIQAVENVISSQSYLPTLTDLLKACKNVNEDNGLPSVEEAYMEAKNPIHLEGNILGLTQSCILQAKA